jgi:RND family efflux transporter MFP subunit
MKSPKKILTGVIILLVLSAAGAGVWWRVRGAGKESAATPSGSTANNGPAPANSADSTFSTDLPIPVEGAQVVRGDLILEVRASGQAAAWQGTSVRALVAGQLKNVAVRENMPVTEGATLMRIDPTELQLALDDAKAQLDRANATFREQTIGDDRITDPAVKAEREKAARIRSGVDGAEVAVRRAEMNLARTTITAPFAGRVAGVKVVLGQHVSAGEELLQIVDIDPIKVEVQVLESEIGQLRAGGKAVITFAAFPGEPFRGTIETINPMVDQQTRQARVTVLVPNGSGRILPGMYASVVLDARHLANRILVPRSSILERDVDRRTMLFVFSGEGTEGVAEWRYVTVGMGNSQQVEIVPNPETKMVEPGEIVLTGGHYTLTHGARIKLTENAAAEGGRPR